MFPLFFCSVASHCHVCAVCLSTTDCWTCTHFRLDDSAQNYCDSLTSTRLMHPSFLLFFSFQLNTALLQGIGVNAVSKAETKFLLIPCSFLLLRIWTQIIVILFVYVKIHPSLVVTRFLIYAGVSIHAHVHVHGVMSWCSSTVWLLSPQRYVCVCL